MANEHNFLQRAVFLRGIIHEYLKPKRVRPISFANEVLEPIGHSSDDKKTYRYSVDFTIDEKRNEPI